MGYRSNSVAGLKVSREHDRKLRRVAHCDINRVFSRSIRKSANIDGANTMFRKMISPHSQTIGAAGVR
jgi:hypothetical protein